MHVNGTTATQSLLAMLRMAGVTPTITPPASAGTPAAGLGPEAIPAFSVSAPGAFFHRLEQLQRTDPTRFQQLTADIADQLDAAAAGTRTLAGAQLADLATRFRNASEGGDLAQLKPPASSTTPHSTLAAYTANAPRQTALLFEMLVDANKASANSASTQEIVDRLWAAINAHSRG